MTPGRRSESAPIDRLYQIQQEVQQRCEQIAITHGNWPCRSGCDDCCRSLAAVPRITQQEWQLVAAALDALPPGTAASVRQHIRDSANPPHPVVCPLLDRDSGTCLVYQARPVACRSYGFYAERQNVLGCHRIAALSQQSPDVVWGNHSALEAQLRSLGQADQLSVCLASS